MSAHDNLVFEFRVDPIEGPSIWVNGRSFVRGVRYEGHDRWDERVYRALRRGLLLVAAQDKRVTVKG